jgi:hypothetical protein
MSEYKEIKIPTQDKPAEQGITIEFDDDIKDIEVEDLPTTKEVEQKQIEEPKQEPKKEKEGGSSAQRRIRELNSRMKEAEARAAEAEERAKLAEQKALEGKKENKSSLKVTLEDKIKVLTTRMKEAMEAGNSEEVINLQDDLINSKMELAGVLHEIKTTESYQEQTKKQEIQKPIAPQIPEKALEWIEEYPEFNTDELFRASTIIVNNQMISEGYNPKDAEFYQELNKRLGKRFPEIFGVEEKKGVESTKEQSDDDEKDVKEKSPMKARVKEQTVSGSSRTSSTNISSPTKKNSVTLSPADIQQAERWGLSLEQMARRIAHLEKNRENSGGYVPIKIG